MTDPADLAELFSSLSSGRKAAFLVRVAHAETLNVRNAYDRIAPDAEGMFRSSELIHRLCGYAHAVLGAPTSRDQDRSMIEMILEAAGRRGEDVAAELEDWLRAEQALQAGELSA